MEKHITYTKEFQVAKPKKFEEIQPHPNTEGLDFDTFFDRYIKEHMELIEKKRIKDIKRGILALIASIVIFALTVLLMQIFPNKDIIGYITSIPLLICILIAVCAPNSYKQSVKESIMNLLLSYLGDFKRTNKSEYSHRDASKIFAYYSNIAMLKKFNDPPIIDDHIEGTYKGIFVEIEEVELTETHKKITSKGSETETTTVFKGLIFSFPQIKQTPAMIITRNRSYGYPQNVGEEVKLEDIEYQKIYKTSSTDQIEARVVLQPAFMERLKELDKKDMKVACCFQDRQVYIAIRTFKDMFEMPLFKSALDKENYRGIITQIEDVLSIIDTLKIVK